MSDAGGTGTGTERAAEPVAVGEAVPAAGSAVRPGTAARPSGGHKQLGHGQLLTGVAWAVLLLGLWLWGSDVTDKVAAQLPATGDVAAVGRPLGPAPQRAHTPVPASDAARPSRIDIAALGVRAAVVESGLDANGQVTAPPATSPALVGWYAQGPRPGAVGAAVLVDGSAAGGLNADAGKRRGAFHGLSGITPGERIEVRRTDGATAQFTVEDVRLYDRADFDARKAYGAHERDRAEVRLVTGGGTFDRAEGAYRSKVVVSAYLTGFRSAGRAAQES